MAFSCKRSSEDPFVEIDDVELLAVTEKAYLVRIPDHEPDEWVPVSQIDDELTEINEKGDRGVLSLARWLAKKKGLIEE